MKTNVLLSILLLVMIPTALARETPPPGGEPRAYELPGSTSMTLDNGLKLTLIDFGAIPKVTIVATVAAGNLHEGDALWLADLTGEMLLEGAGDRDSNELAAASANMGGEIGVGVGVTETQAAIDVLSEFGPDAIALLSDVLRRPALPASEFERVRSNLLKNLAIARTQPQTIASQAFRKRLFGDHPYGAGLPDPEEFEKLTIDDVRRFAADHYGAADAHIYVAGKFDRTEVIAAVKRHFGDWAGPRVTAQFVAPAGTPVPGREFIARAEAPQSTLYLGLPVVDPTHPDYIALSVTNTLLGGSFGSRITSNIREDKGYTYSPRSTLSVSRQSGYWVQTADVTTDVTGPAIDEIVNEIQRLQAAPPPAEELDRIKNYRIGTFVLGNATRGGLISQLQFLQTHGLGPDYLTEFVSRVNAITPQRVQEVARRYLDVGEMALVVVGDPNVVPAQLDALDRVAR